MKKTNYVRKIIENYCVIDTETTGLSFKYDEVIEVGMLKVRNGKIVDRYSQLIKPNQKISSFITSLTGISNKMVAKMPNINDVEEDILNFIGDDVILGHHTSFDINFLNVAFNSKLKNQYIDTMQFCRKLYPELGQYSLSYMAEYLCLTNNEHRALADCITTQELYESLKRTMVKKNLQIKDLWANRKYSIDTISITPQVKKINKNSFFYGKHVAFSGKFREMSQEEAMQRVVNQGGILDKEVTKKTNYLVFSDYEYDRSLHGEKSQKYQIAKSLKLSSYDINLIIEDEFYILVHKKRRKKML